MDFQLVNYNWVDLLIILLLLFYLWNGWGRGLIFGILDLAGFLLSFFTALRSYSFLGSLLAANFSLPKGIANACGFLLGGILAEIVFSLVTNYLVGKFYQTILIKRKSNNAAFSLLRFDKILGFIPALGEAIIFTAFILTLLVTLPIQGAIKNDIISSFVGSPLIANTQGIERQLNLIFGEAVNETLTFLTINPSPVSNEWVDLRFTQTNVKIDEAAEQTMLILINQERVKAGLLHLSLSWELRDLARETARDMMARGYFSHYNPEGLSPFDRMEKAGVKFIAGGENLALAPNVHLAHQGLMSSPGHRANILSADFAKVGVGVIDGGIYGEMFVQEFTD
ncbi:hypothetical protein FJY90_01095 [Candidatus Gottesmanbacteria bacterium]|nr:hypothetical protein [Candidatus Gottesmanbacteria bacterium]